MNLNGFGYTRGWKKASLSFNSVPEKGFSYTKHFELAIIFCVQILILIVWAALLLYYVL